MKIWIGLSFFATTVISISGGIWIGNLIYDEDSPVSVEPELIVEEKIEEEVEPKNEVVTETKPVETPKTEPQPIVSNTPKTNAQPAISSKVSESTQKTEIKNTSESIAVTPTYKYSNIHDFEKAYVGWCPKDVPEGEYHLPLRKYVTLGYIDSYVNYRDIETAVIYAWTLLEGGYGGRNIEVYLQNWTNLNQYVITISPNTREVKWEHRHDTFQSKEPSDEVVQKLDAITYDFKTRMNQLDQKYYAKCGY